MKNTDGEVCLGILRMEVTLRNRWEKAAGVDKVCRPLRKKGLKKGLIGGEGSANSMEAGWEGGGDILGYSDCTFRKRFEDRSGPNGGDLGITLRVQGKGSVRQCKTKKNLGGGKMG